LRQLFFSTKEPQQRDFASLRTAEQNGSSHLIFLNLQAFSNAPFARVTFAASNSHRFNMGGLNGNMRVVARYPWA
jgi:hypothetical protein